MMRRASSRPSATEGASTSCRERSPAPAQCASVGGRDSMGRMHRISRWLSLALAVGCGPRVDDVAADPSDDTTTTGTTATSTTATTSTTTTATSTTTTGTTTTTTTSTADETTTSGVAEDTTATSAGFIVDPDGGCVFFSCDVWGQDCPEGEKCLPWNGGGEGPSDGCAKSRCSPLAADTRAPGESCTVDDEPWSGVDDCELGAYCWDVDPMTLEGVCVALCQGSEAEPACADAALSCFILTSTSVTACVPACDPLVPACAPGSTCVLSAANDQPPVCMPVTLGVPTGEGSECEWELGCGDGFACVEGAQVSGCDGSYCCATLCDLDAPACGEVNPACEPITGAPAGVGGCMTGRE